MAIPFALSNDQQRICSKGCQDRKDVNEYNRMTLKKMVRGVCLK